MQANTQFSAYGSVSKILHWLMAVLFLWLIATVAARLSGSEADLANTMWSTHYTTGVLIFAVGLIRAIWAFATRSKRPSHHTGLTGKLAQTGHLLLYSGMLLIPMIAILRSYGSGRGLSVWGFQIIPGAEEKADILVKIAGALHGELGLAFIALILGHIAAALLHHFILKDGTLARMTMRS